jgi:hypothetical protein
MTRAFGFIGLLIVLGVGAYIYKQQMQATSAPGATANPVTTVDTLGVRNDLIAIANAERRRYASDGRYVSIDDLISNGDISMQKPSRGPFTYSADVSEQAFTIIATYNGPDAADIPKTMSIDQTMQIKQ